jgi:hypothetical protein
MKNKPKIINNFYCGNEVDYDEQCQKQCDGCVNATGVDYGYLNTEQEIPNPMSSIDKVEELCKKRNF